MTNEERKRFVESAQGTGEFSESERASKGAQVDSTATPQNLVLPNLFAPKEQAEPASEEK